MNHLLEDHGVPPKRILKEERSNSTLESVLRCTPILRGLIGPRGVVVCTDRYHQFRCRLLLLLMGVRTQAVKIESWYRSSFKLQWGYYYLREFPVLIYNCLLLGPVVALIHIFKVKLTVEFVIKNSPPDWLSIQLVSPAAINHYK